MALITPDVSGIVDGSIPTASSFTTPLATITNAINGGLDTTNMTANAVNLQTVGQSVSWTTFTPTWTGSGGNPAILNGTITAAYAQFGRFVSFRIAIVSGTTTTYGTGNYSFTFPTTAITYQVAHPIGICTVVGNSQIYAGNLAVWATTTTFQIYNPATTGGTLQSATSPYTWAATTANQKILISGSYESAA